MMAELRRRRVFRVAGVYAVTAWAAMEAVDLVFPRLALPEWTVTLVVALALLGFPVTVGLAWAFEVTPDGVRRTQPADPALVAPASRWGGWATAAALGAVLLLIGAAAWRLDAWGGSNEPYQSIAVLPFADLSGDPDNEYFGDGMAEQLLNALAGVEGLKVAARTSAFAFKGTSVDVRTIGDSLGVATVLEGSVRRSADRIRIAAQLIDAHTGYRLWSDSYDRPLTEVFAVQDAIAAEIAAALSIRLGDSDGDGLFRGGTADVEAYDLYLLGRQKWGTREVPLLKEAAGHFEQAIARDSSFALAWSGLADAIDALAWRAPESRVRVPEARYAAHRAIVIDPGVAESWASLGILALDFDADVRTAELALRRATALKPSYAMAHHWLSDVLRWTGRFQEAVASSRRAAELDPISGLPVDGYAQSLLAAGRAAEAAQQYRRLRKLGWKEPATALSALGNARVLGLQIHEVEAYARELAAPYGYSNAERAALVGRAVLIPELRDEAGAILEQMEAVGIPSMHLATLWMALEEPDSALALLERAHTEGEYRLVGLAGMPVFRPIQYHPRFLRIAEAALHPGMIGR